MRHDRVRTLNRALAELDPAALRAEMDDAAQLLAVALDRAGVSFTERRVEHALDMNYVGQTHAVMVKLPLAPDGSGELSREIVQRAFTDTYSGAYGRLLPHVSVRVLNLRTTVIGARPKIDLLSMAPSADASIATARTGLRQIWFGAWQEAAVYDRLALPVGAEIAGPAVLEQPDTTILIEPGQRGVVDRFGNLLIEAAAP